MIGTINETRIRPRDINFRLIIYVLILTVIGVFLVHSATASEESTSIFTATFKQIAGAAAGLVLAAVITAVDYRKLTKYAWIFFAASILSLIYVRWFCSEIYGAHRWIYLKMLGTIQPSEFAKPAMILMLSFVVYKLKDKISKPYGLLLYLAVGMVTIVLVLIEPDLSTTIVLGIILLAILFLAGLNYKWIIGFLIILIPIAAAFLVAVYQPGQSILNKILEEHQVLRINAFFFPDEYPAYTYQQSNSIMAIGSGGLFGKGLNNANLDSVKNGNFLSEENCDFIFAVVGEELGFVGSCVIILLLALIVLECFITARKCKDTVGKCIAGSVGASIGIQSLINIGVATWMIPNTGIPLPFVSAGLSSLISTYIMIGLVLSVGLWGRLKKRVFY